MKRNREKQNKKITFNSKVLSVIWMGYLDVKASIRSTDKKKISWENLHKDLFGC